MGLNAVEKVAYARLTWARITVPKYAFIGWPIIRETPSKSQVIDHVRPAFFILR